MAGLCGRSRFRRFCVIAAPPPLSPVILGKTIIREVADMRYSVLGIFVIFVLGIPCLSSADEDAIELIGPEGHGSPVITVRLNGRTTASPDDVEFLGWTLEGTNVDFYADLNSGSSGGEMKEYFLIRAIPLLRRDTYQFNYLVRSSSGESFQLADSTTVEIDRRWPYSPGVLTAFVWPPDPTPLDRTRYYFTAFSACQSGSDGTAIINRDNDSDGVFEDRVSVSQSREACERVELPGLRSVELGRLMPGQHELTAYYQFDEFILDPLPWLEQREFRVRPVLPGRLSGSWYNPDESGHGLSLEVLDGGERLLAYWFTFDELGNQAWLIADGGVDESGTSATLDAQIVQGGEFPPTFDPEAVDRIPWGTIRFEFEDCSSALMSWETGAAGFSNGEMPVERLSTISGFGCTTPPPKSLRNNTWRLTPFPVVEELAEPPEGAGG